MEVEAERLLEDGGRSGGEEAVSGVRRVSVCGDGSCIRALRSLLLQSPVCQGGLCQDRHGG